MDVDFSDILEVLDIGAMVHFEARHKGGWGVSLDSCGRPGYFAYDTVTHGPMIGVIFNF